MQCCCPQFWLPSLTLLKGTGLHLQCIYHGMCTFHLSRDILKVIESSFLFASQDEDDSDFEEAPITRSRRGGNSCLAGVFLAQSARTFAIL